MNAVSVPVVSEFKETEHTKAWETIILYAIAKKIAEKYRLIFIYDTKKEINIQKIEQNGQTDSNFLKNLCQKYGFGVKIYSKKLILWNYKEYMKRSPVCIIYPDMVSKWSYKSSIQGTYTAAKVSYTNTNGETIEIVVGKEGRTLTINEKADSVADAELIGENAIFNANRKKTTMNIIMPPNLSITATCCITIKNFVEEVTHSLTKSYTQNIRLSKITEEEEKTGEAKDTINGTEYIVKTGGHLMGFSKKILWKQHQISCHLQSKQGNQPGNRKKMRFKAV